METSTDKSKVMVNIKGTAKQRSTYMNGIQHKELNFSNICVADIRNKIANNVDDFLRLASMSHEGIINNGYERKINSV